jgi:GntR family transcriptional repressor for pyruvate dehydrogenase complex
MESLFTQPVRKTTLYQSILDEIREAIRTGKLKGGDQLPSEREMAKAFGTSRAAVRQAIVAMEVSGLVEVKPGSGTYLRDFNLNNYLEPLAYLIYGTEAGVLDILELRIALETEAAALAAKRATAEDIEVMAKALKSEKESMEAGQMAIEEDVEFHSTISKATHNNVFDKVMYTIRELLNCSFTEQRNKTWGLPDRVEVILKEHQEIFDAIKNHSPEQARAAMRKHLERLKGELTRLNRTD